MRVVNYGGGVNSTALLCWAVANREPVDLVIFADTGSERPPTYRYVETFSAWLQAHEQPTITIVRWIRVRGETAGQFIALHDWCESGKTLPSRSFGLSGCTVKWKQQPVDRYLKEHAAIKACHARGERVERWIGFDAGEPERAKRMLAKNPDAHLWSWKAPLVDHDLDRDGCLKLIADAGLESPGKSSCWMCPSMTKRDIDALGRAHPELLSRALKMEATAIETGNVRSRGGLGGRLNWGEYVQSRCGLDPDEIPCGCFDGEDD